jgi:hypothetical protein
MLTDIISQCKIFHKAGVDESNRRKLHLNNSRWNEMNDYTLKLFTREDANSKIPFLKNVFERIFALIGKLTEDVVETEKLKRLNNLNGDRKRLQELIFEMNEIKEELQEEFSVFSRLGVMVRKLERGIVDFPTIINGDLGYFCWRVNEDEIVCYHGVNDPEKKILSEKDRFLAKSNPVPPSSEK